MRNEITTRGVVDVLRKGVKHLSTTFTLYIPLPFALSDTGQTMYKKNKFCVIRQLHYSKENARLAVDVVLFVNGLPILTMELKNQITCQDTTHAVAQYRADRSAKDLLFMPKRCAVHFAVDDDTIEMCTRLCGMESWFLPFNKGYNDGAGNPVNPHGLKTSYLWEDILTKERLSDILEHYAQVTKEKDTKTGRTKEKIVWPRYHQLELVRELLSSTRNGDIGQRFLIQHSAGSGKSYSITWLAYQLVEMLKDGKNYFDSIILVTDRVNLDKQLRDNVKSFTHNENIVDWANSSKRLEEYLDSGKKIILTTVHKFSFILTSIGSDLAHKRFAVIIDEAHSSQSGKMSANQNQVLSGSVKDDEDEINDKIEKFTQGRKMAGNANFYAFTATPKNKTLETFGVPFTKDDGETGHRPFHVYSMRQAIEEGFILDVLKGYTTYQSYYSIRKAVEDDPEFERMQAMKKIRYFVESQPETVKKKAEVMVEHFCTKVAHKIGGEARCMVITTGIERAIDYYYEITKLLEERNSPYKAIVAFSGEYLYNKVCLDEQRLNGFPSSQIEGTFRTGAYRFLIVADKFQTGYDEPLLHTMYVDKPLHGVKTVQTLSRLNRTCPKKNDTCVLDFVNTCEEVEKDFQTFYKTTILSKETDLNKLNDLLATVEGYDIYTNVEVETLNGEFWSVASREKIDPILDTIKERFVALDDEAKVKCKSAIKAFIRTYEFLSTIMPDTSLEWEKKETLFTLLIHKLPKLAEDDLTQGLLEAIDFDKYRLEKKEEHDIQLKNESAEIGPVPTSSGGSLDEPDMQPLSTIKDQFNKLYGNIPWKNKDLASQQMVEVAKNVAHDDTVRNSMLNSDEETANQDCDASVQRQMTKMTQSHTELMTVYWKNKDFRDGVNHIMQESARASINPHYDERALKQKIRERFKNDFADFCDNGHDVKFDEVIDIFFKIVNVDTIPDYQGLRSILRHILNCLYRAQHREEDYRSWYADIVSRFEAFLKKIYWIETGEKVPLTAEGRQPAFLDTVRHFPHVESLHYTRDKKLGTFKEFYQVVYSWRNNENHRALDVPVQSLQKVLHAAVALYLYTSMVCANDVKDKI